jgi:sugar phosphate isomerase/epimerase
VATELDTVLAEFETTIQPGTPRVSDIGAVSTSLIMANSNSGPAILRPAVLDSVRAYLDQLAKMGSSGVEVQISYPIGSKDYPNQDAYVAFYRAVIQAAHQRGFKVLVETSSIFSNSPFTDVQFDFSKLTPAQYFQARSDEIVTIAKDIRPDYLALGEEPVNERVFAAVNYTPEQYIAFVNSAAAAVRKELGANVGSVKVGVGTGTWEFDLFQSFIKQTDLDFYDIHIYPLQGSPGGLQTARQMAKLAQAKGKPTIIGETWLYKMAASEIGQTAGATAAEAFRRDAFSFWEPLDARYIRDILALGAEFKMPFVSFWGARFFFGQLDWTALLDALDFRGISGTINPTLNQNITSGQRSPLGEAFAEMLRR